MVQNLCLRHDSPNKSERQTTVKSSFHLRRNFKEREEIDIWMFQCSGKTAKQEHPQIDKARVHKSIRLHPCRMKQLARPRQ